MEAFKIKNGISAKRYLGSNGVETAGTVGYDLAGASYDSKSFSVAGQAAAAADGVHFKSDGTKMYVMSAGNNAVYQYSLSTAWDVTTASYDSVSLSVSSQDTGNWRDIDISHDGTTLYGLAGSGVAYQYDLSTAWDLSTASYASKSFDFSTYNTAQGIFVNSDSTKVIICSSTTSSAWEFTLSTAKDISTASYTNNTKDLTGEDSGTVGVSMNSNGTKMFILGSTNDTVYQYSLSTAYDVSTASYDSISFDASTQETGTDQLFFSQDGLKMYIIADEVVYQYSTASLTQTLDLSTGTTFSFTPSGATTVSFTNPPATGTAIGFSVEIIGDGSAITWPSSVKWHLATAPTATATKELYTFVTTDGGTTYYGKKAAEGLA